jgi:hypothetical protein
MDGAYMFQIYIKLKHYAQENVKNSIGIYVFQHYVHPRTLTVIYTQLLQ